MMKRFLVILLVFASLFSISCEREAEDAKATVNSVVAEVNKQDKLSGEYQLSITFDKGAVLYYAKGNIEWDRKAQTAYASFDHTYLGASGKMENYFKDGAIISVDSTKTERTEKDPDDLMSKFPYFSVFDYSEDCGEIKVGENNSGTTYTFFVKNNKEIFESIAGGDIYKMVFSIKDPQPEKTQYGDIECIYTVVDGKLQSCRYEFDVKLFDTPGYVPGYSVPEEEYTIDLHFSGKITYNSFGDNVSVDEFSGEIPAESAETTSEASLSEGSE